MTRQVDLLSYLPLFVQDYREIQAIANAENPEFNFLFQELEKTKNNQFIPTCDEIGISRFERLLNIMPDESDSLEERIKKVLIIWNDSIIYTYKGLIKILNDWLGKNNYSCELKYNEYTFVLELNIQNIININESELYTVLRRIIPANIMLDLVLKSNDRIIYKDKSVSYENRFYTVGNTYKTGTIFKQQYKGVCMYNSLNLKSAGRDGSNRIIMTKEIKTGGIKR